MPLDPSTGLPPQIAIPAVATVAAELRKLTSDHRAAAEHQRELEESRASAADRDTAAHAAALRLGKGDPGARHVEKADAELGTARRRAEALAVAVGACEADLRAAVGKARGEWSRQLDDDAASARQACREAVDALGDAMAALSAATGAQQWLSGFPRRSRYRPGGALGLAGTGSRNGEPVLVTTALDALRAWAEPPAEAPAAPVPPGPQFKVIDLAS